MEADDIIYNHKIHTYTTLSGAQRPWWSNGGGDDDGDGVSEDVRANAFTYYMVHTVPQLATLDGKELTRSIRLRAARAFPALEVGKN
jgi:hypothetical protein